MAIVAEMAVRGLGLWAWAGPKMAGNANVNILPLYALDYGRICTTEGTVAVVKVTLRLPRIL